MSPLPQASSVIAEGAAHGGALTSNVSNIAIGLLVLAYILYSQVRRKQLTAKTRLGIILAAVGLYETWNFTKVTHVTGKDIALTAVSIAIGLGLAVVRANTVR